jgi:hypothetical protein
MWALLFAQEAGQRRWAAGRHELPYPAPCNQARMWQLGPDFLCLVPSSSRGTVE